MTKTPTQQKTIATTQRRNIAAQKLVMNNKILPAQALTGRSLVLIISVMCYLACLSLGALIIINRSVDNWTSDISTQMTLQIKVSEGRDIEADTKKALEILKNEKGIKDASTMGAEESAKLLEPWLGKSRLVEELPIPRLISIAIDTEAPPDVQKLSEKLETALPNSDLDTHERWQKELTRTAGTLRFIGMSILLLISITTITIAVFATRAAIASNKDIVEVLHLVGAQDKYIATQVQTHFIKLGLQAGVIGAVAGGLTFGLLTLWGNHQVSGSLSEVSSRLLLSPTSFGILEYFVFLLIPLSSMLICMFTAKHTVMRLLSRML